MFFRPAGETVSLTRLGGRVASRHLLSALLQHRADLSSSLECRGFLRGVGLPDKLIEYLPSILEQAIQHYSCFISYSSKNDDFIRRLHTDLQDNGVRCWFAPEDMKIGAKIRDTIDQAIRLRDKVLLVLSEASISRDWVEDEVEVEAWAAKLRRSRNIGDFRAWKDMTPTRKRSNGCCATCRSKPHLTQAAAHS
jgi:TIR domain-containing protein